MNDRRFEVIILCITFIISVFLVFCFIDDFIKGYIQSKHWYVEPESVEFQLEPTRYDFHTEPEQGQLLIQGDNFQYGYMPKYISDSDTFCYFLIQEKNIPRVKIIYDGFEIHYIKGCGVKAKIEIKDFELLIDDSSQENIQVNYK